VRVGGNSRGRGGNAREVRMKKDAAAVAVAAVARVGRKRDGTHKRKERREEKVRERRRGF